MGPQAPAPLASRMSSGISRGSREACSWRVCLRMWLDDESMNSRVHEFMRSGVRTLVARAFMGFRLERKCSVDSAAVRRMQGYGACLESRLRLPDANALRTLDS